MKNKIAIIIFETGNLIKFFIVNKNYFILFLFKSIC